jgi:hypothetical protein
VGRPVARTLVRRGGSHGDVDHEEAGVSIIDALDQERYWVGRDGRRHELATMHQEHRRNLLEWLRRRAAPLARERDRHVNERGLTPDDDPLLFAPPNEWIERSPFVRALKAEIALEDALTHDALVDVPDPLDALTIALRLRRRALDRG